MSADAGHALAVEGLSVSFGDRQVLREVSFHVPTGAFVGILGPNGAGKTTLLRALLGQLAARGQIAIERPVAYVPQLSGAGSAFRVDALGAVLMGLFPRLGWWRRPSRADRTRAQALLERVGLGDRARSSFDDLSGGQRQRVLLARALAQEGRVLLLDEPLAGVDALSRDLLLRAIDEERAGRRTVLMTTHDLAEGSRVCDRMLILNRELISEGTTELIFTQDVLRRAYGSDVLVLDRGIAVLDDPHHSHDEGPRWSG